MRASVKENIQSSTSENSSDWDSLTQLAQTPDTLSNEDLQVSEYFSSKISENIATLEGSPQQQKIYQLLSEEYPELSCVRIIEASSKESEPLGCSFSASNVLAGNTITPPTVKLIFDPQAVAEKNDKLAKNGAIIQLLQTGLGISEDEITPELLSIFTLLHEFGHAHDFFSEIQSIPKSHTALLSAIDAYKDAHKDESNRYLALTQCIYSPDSFEENIEFEDVTHSEITPFVQSYCENILQKSATQPQSEFRQQEYRLMPGERYADRFAIDFLRRHANSLGINLDSSPSSLDAQNTPNNAPAEKENLSDAEFLQQLGLYDTEIDQDHYRPPDIFVIGGFRSGDTLLHGPKHSDTFFQFERSANAIRVISNVVLNYGDEEIPIEQFYSQAGHLMFDTAQGSYAVLKLSSPEELKAAARRKSTASLTKALDKPLFLTKTISKFFKGGSSH